MQEKGALPGTAERDCVEVEHFQVVDTVQHRVTEDRGLASLIAAF